MPGFIRPALAYFAAVFAGAFALGVLRVTVILPLTGPLVAVALEVPVVLTLSWIVSGRVLRRWPLAMPLGQTLRAFAQAMTTPAGSLGLAGQVGFGLLPALRR